MIFKVKDGGVHLNNINNIVYLIRDNWDDWFTFSTMYDLEFIDSDGNNHYIGKVKIGEFSMDDGQRRPKIPEQFQQLDERFFSLGQSEYYYENLNSLGESIRHSILCSLNDVALDEKLFVRALEEHVTTSSLLRDISQTTVRRQFRRMANGGARLTKYYFSYVAPKYIHSLSDPMKLSFQVIPESNPPTNIHVLIGRNGVGKTHMIKNMITALIDNKSIELEVGAFSENATGNKLFANIVCVAFSAFDESLYELSQDTDRQYNVPFIHVGLPQHGSNSKLLVEEFIKSLKTCIRGAKYALWEKAVSILESDPIFEESNVKDLSVFDSEKEFEEKSGNLFRKLSSGHKIIILTVTKLVQTVEEKTLVFLDEPEGHLHPPLLSAFIRALSDLLIAKNGVAIIATHSPVILQEVPRSCVWKLRRTGHEAIAERLEIESFGENIGSLISEVFGLEVTYSGFHSILVDAVKKHGSYKKILSYFNEELGMEARAILKALIATYQQEDIE